MIKDIMKDPLFLAQKSTDATKADQQVVVCLLYTSAPLPAMVPALGVDNIVKIWREHKVRGKGASLNRAKTLVDAAHDSVGKSCLRT